MKDFAPFYTILLLVVLLTNSGCISMYRPIEPLSLDFQNNYTKVIEQEGISLSYRHGILKEKGNRRHARNEWRSGLSLIAVRIQNNRSDTLRIPEDIRFCSDMDTLYVIPIDEAFELLDESDLDAWKESVEIDEPKSVFAIDVFTFIKAVKSSQNFYDEMDLYYLAPVRLPPGSSMTGLLCLGVKPGRALAIHLVK